MKNNSYVDEWLDSAINAWERFAGTKVEPFNAFGFHTLYADLHVKRLLEAIKRAEKLKLDPKALAKTFISPHTPRYETAFLMFDAKTAGITKEDRMLLIGFFNEILKNLCVDDRFARYSNQKHTNQEIERIVKETDWIKDKQIYKEVASLSMACMELMWALWTDIFPHNGYDIAGPYDVSKYFIGKNILLIKDFFGFKPTEIWPDTKEYKFDSIRILTVLKDTKCELDLLGHLTCDKNLTDATTHFAVIVNDESLTSLEQLINLREYVEGIAVEQYKKYEKLSFEEKKKKYLWQRDYQFKNFFKAVGMDWKPTKEEYDRVRDKKIPHDPIFDNEKRIAKWSRMFPFLARLGLFYIRKLGDPRIDFGMRK